MAMAKARQSGLVILFVALLCGTARGQMAPNTPPPVLSPPAAPPPAPNVPIEPLTAGPASSPMAPSPLLTPTPAAPVDAPPLAGPAVPDDGPFYTRWWFWTAIGAAGVTTVAILLATSSPSPPHTDFGNMPAF